MRRTFKRPLWTGGELAGKTILLHAEQGHGDTIQFARYVPVLERAGATVLLEVQQALKPLLATLEGVAQIFGRDEQGNSEPLPAFDTHQYLISLAHILGTELGTIPVEIPYIYAPPDRLKLWRERLPPTDPCASDLPGPAIRRSKLMRGARRTYSRPHLCSRRTPAHLPFRLRPAFQHRSAAGDSRPDGAAAGFPQ